MRLLLTLALIVTWVATARAETVRVRSGEHAEYSRLAMTLPSRMEWRIEDTENGARLLLKSDDLTLDTSTVFDRIPQDRLAAVTWQPADKTLQMTFGCECEAKVFWHADTMLVLDIRARPSSETMRPDAVATENERPSIPPAAAFPAVSHPRTRAVDLTLEGLEEAETDVVTLPPEARDQLLRQVGRAASQGLLSPRNIRTTKPEEPSKTEDGGEPTAKPAGISPTAHINLRAQSSIDRDFLNSIVAQQQAVGTSRCLPASQIDVAAWGDNASFGKQIAALHLRLSGELDVLDPDVTQDLVRLYLYFGFGAEARATLELMPEDSANRAILVQLAAIAEHGYIGPVSSLSGQLDCTSPAALWSALSYRVLPADQPMDTDAILRAFDALPEHLRAYYGPILSERFLQADRAEISDKILRILDRNQETMTPQSDMASADLHTAKGEFQKAEASLEAVVESNSEPSVNALIRMIETRFAARREISYDQAQLAGAYAYEHQDDAIGPALAAAHVRALVASGAIDQAFAVFHRDMPLFAHAQKGDLRSDLFARLATHPDDIAVLRHSLALPPKEVISLRPDAGNAVAGRLLTLGFADTAALWIAEDIRRGHPATRDRQILRARLALAKGTPRLAIVELLGLADGDADMLRADARAMAGEHVNAAQLYAAANQPEKAQHAAFLGGAWALAARPDDAVYANLENLMNRENSRSDEIAEDGRAVLAHDRHLLEESANMRGTLDALLAANPAPDAQ